uniref:Uncharacterized protein n=1 Tax=Rhizophora mucronata TaxID=61149 RepID=A0A2P2MZP1_RHIMU
MNKLDVLVFAYSVSYKHRFFFFYLPHAAQEIDIDSQKVSCLGI